MRAVLADRVFDVIGEVLSINDVNLPEMLREAAYDPRRLDEYLDQIARIDPTRLKQYEQATGIALARANVDFSGFQQANVEAEERRLMPRYVEEHFIKSAADVGLKVEPRADGLWRIEHVLADLRSDRLQAVRKLGKPETSYRKATFRKEHLDQDQHLDAILFGPGHPLYAAVDERLNELFVSLAGGVGVYIDEASEVSYRLHFFEASIRGQSTKGEPQTLHGELVAVREDLSGPTTGTGRFSVVSADSLLDLPPHPEPPAALNAFDAAPAADFIKVTYQMGLRSRAQEERRHFVDICRDYLTRSFDARVRAAQDRVMALRDRGSPPSPKWPSPGSGPRTNWPTSSGPARNGSPAWTGSLWSNTVRCVMSPRRLYYRPVRWVLTLHRSSGWTPIPNPGGGRNSRPRRSSSKTWSLEGFPRELIQRVAHEKLLGFDYRAQRVEDPQFGVMEVGGSR